MVWHRQLQTQAQLFLLAPLLEHALQIPEGGGEIKLGERELHAAGVDLREIQNLVDQVKQMISTVQDSGHRVTMERVQGGFTCKDLGVAQNGVHGRADLVAHVGQELRLRLVGRLSRRLGRLPDRHLVEQDGIRLPNLRCTAGQ